MFVGLTQAATSIGYSVPGLRKLVKRQAIRFFQPHKNCPIRFRQEWIDDFNRRAGYNGAKRRDVAQSTSRSLRPRTLADAARAFTPAVVLRIILDCRYPPSGKPRCPSCRSLKATVALSGVCKCRDCGRLYSLRDGSIADGSTARLRAWLIAAWCVTVGQDRITVRDLAATLRMSQCAVLRLLDAWRALQQT